MADVAQTLAALDSKFTNPSFQPGFINSLNSRNEFYKLINKKRAKFPAGEGHNITTLTDDLVSYAPAGNAAGLFPDASRLEFARYVILSRNLHLKAQIDGIVLDRATGTLNSAGDIFKQTSLAFSRVAQKQLQRALFADGSGKLGVVTAYAGGTPSITLAATGDKTKLVRYIKKGMNLAVYDNSNDTYRGKAKVTAINRSTNVVTLDGTIAATDADDYVTLASSAAAGTLDLDVWGLNYHVDDTTPATYQGITRSSIEVSQAKVFSNSGTNRALSKDLMHQAYMWPTIATDALDSDPYRYIMDSSTLYEFNKLFMGQTQFRPKEENLGGFSMTPSWMKPIIQDSDCPYHTIFYVNPSDFTVYYYRDWEFVKNGSSLLWFNTGASASDTYYMYMIARLNMACTKPRAQVKIEDITATPIAA